MVGGSVDSNQIHTPVGVGGVYVGGGVDEFAFGSPVREEGDETRDETSGASPSFPPAESPPSFIVTPATRASPLGSNETPPGDSRPDSTPPGDSRPDSTPPGGCRRAHEDPSSSPSSVPSTPFTVSRAAKSGTPDPSELLLDGGDPASDVASLSAPGGILHPLTPGGVRPSAAARRPAPAPGTPTTRRRCLRRRRSRRSSCPARRANWRRRRGSSRRRRRRTTWARRTSWRRTRAAADSGDVATLAATAEMNASAARARPSAGLCSRRWLRNLRRGFPRASPRTRWRRRCWRRRSSRGSTPRRRDTARRRTRSSARRTKPRATSGRARGAGGDVRDVEARSSGITREADRASRPQVANAEALADERRDASAALAHAKATGRSEALSAPRRGGGCRARAPSPPRFARRRRRRARRSA